jgi:hypothetical protein
MTDQAAPTSGGSRGRGGTSDGSDGSSGSLVFFCRESGGGGDERLAFFCHDTRREGTTKRSFRRKEDACAADVAEGMGWTAMMQRQTVENRGTVGSILRN